MEVHDADPVLASGRRRPSPGQSDNATNPDGCLTPVPSCIRRMGSCTDGIVIRQLDCSESRWRNHSVCSYDWTWKAQKAGKRTEVLNAATGCRGLSIGYHPRGGGSHRRSHDPVCSASDRHLPASRITACTQTRSTDPCQGIALRTPTTATPTPWWSIGEHRLVKRKPADRNSSWVTGQRSHTTRRILPRAHSQSELPRSVHQQQRLPREHRRLLCTTTLPWCTRTNCALRGWHVPIATKTLYNLTDSLGTNALHVPSDRSGQRGHRILGSDG